MERVGGIIQLKVDGETYDAKGAFTYNLGKPMREPVVGADKVHGFKETPQVGFIEGEITDRKSLSLSRLVTMTGATVTLDLANGKMITAGNATYAGEGTGSSEEGAIPFRFISSNVEEIT